MNTIKVSRNDVAQIVSATFPDYRGRKISIRPTQSVRFSDLNWSGGSRSQYRSATLGGLAAGSMDRFNQMAPWDPQQVEGQSIDIPAGYCIVRHSIFCGKDVGLTIYVRPEDMPKHLEGPAR